LVLRSEIRFDAQSSPVEFIEENGGGPGVRLRKRHQKKNWTAGMDMERRSVAYD
jgi:hypothetical protein